MSISLTKGQKVDLTKSNPGLSHITVGLGWDPIKNGKRGLFSSFRGQNIDCDASVLMLQDGYLVQQSDVISFQRLQSLCGSVIHSGDNLTGDGDGDGDDEQIKVTLKEVPVKFDKLVFVVNIYAAASRKQDFGMIENAYIRLVNSQTQEELMRYNLSENYAGKTSLIFGEIYRKDGEWRFAAIGSGTKDTSITQLTKRYRQ